MATLAYSGSMPASIWKTTLIGPPSLATKSNSLSILSSTSSEAAMTKTASMGMTVSRKI